MIKKEYLNRFISIFGKGIHCMNIILELSKEGHPPSWLIPFWIISDQTFSMPKIQKMKWFAIEIGINNVAFKVFYANKEKNISNSSDIYDIYKDIQYITTYSIVNLGYGFYSIFEGDSFSNDSQLCLPCASIFELLNHVNLTEENSMNLQLYQNS